MEIIKREAMSDGKKNIIGMLLEEYDIKTAKDIEDALKNLLGGTIQEMLKAEMDEHLGYEAYKRSDILPSIANNTIVCNVATGGCKALRLCEDV